MLMVGNTKFRAIWLVLLFTVCLIHLPQTTAAASESTAAELSPPIEEAQTVPAEEAVPTTLAEEVTVSGDMNGDGTFSLSDLALIMS
jgi:hypothetical protein